MEGERQEQAVASKAAAPQVAVTAAPAVEEEVVGDRAEISKQGLGAKVKGENAGTAVVTALAPQPPMPPLAVVPQQQSDVLHPSGKSATVAPASASTSAPTSSSEGASGKAKESSAAAAEIVVDKVNLFLSTLGSYVAENL